MQLMHASVTQPWVSQYFHLQNQPLSLNLPEHIHKTRCLPSLELHIKVNLWICCYFAFDTLFTFQMRKSTLEKWSGSSVPLAQCGVQDSDTLTCFGLLFDHEDVIGFWETVVEPLFLGRHKETMENFSKNPPKSSLGNQWASWDYWQSRVRGHFQQQNHWNFSPIRSRSCVGEVALSTYLPHIYIVETYKNIELIQRVGRCKRRDWELQWGSWNLCVYWILLWRSIVSQEAWGG